MEKPTIFFSHSSSDKNTLLRLKELFLEKTGGAIDVFLSSDGQSIPLGRNWVHRIQNALNNASLMIVFITPNSLHSKWIYFESGFAYAKNIRVIPVGFLGINLSSISPPISLLQGFNISNKDGLDNLIALVNEIFSHNHKSCFSELEYKNIISEDGASSNNPLYDFYDIIESIRIVEKNIQDLSSNDALIIIKRIMDENSIEYWGTKNSLKTFGLEIHTIESMRSQPLNIILDPLIINSILPLIKEIHSEICIENKDEVQISFIFNDNIKCKNEEYKISARLIGTSVKLTGDNIFAYKGLNFSIGQDIVQSKISLLLYYNLTSCSLDQIAELMQLLFRKKILYKNGV